MDNVVEDSRLQDSIDKIGQTAEVIIFFSGQRFVVRDGLRRIHACSLLEKDVLAKTTKCTGEELDRMSDIVMKLYTAGLR